MRISLAGVTPMAAKDNGLPQPTAQLKASSGFVRQANSQNARPKVPSSKVMRRVKK